MIVRRQYGSKHDDWDAQLVRNYRAQGGQGFQPVGIDFFFGVPDLATCERLATTLRADEASVDFREATSEGATGYTLRARKELRVSVDTLQAHSRRYRELVKQHAATYDGWAVEGVTKRAQEEDTRLKPKRLDT
jgi:hypothetical protein